MVNGNTYKRSIVLLILVKGLGCQQLAEIGLFFFGIDQLRAGKLKRIMEKQVRKLMLEFSRVRLDCQRLKAMQHLD